MEHGAQGEVADEAWDAARLDEDLQQRLVGEKPLLAPRKPQVVLDVAAGMRFVHGGHAVTHGDALAKRQMHSERKLGQELRLAREDDEQRILRVHLEVEQDSKLIEEGGSQEIGLIEDEDRLFALGCELGDTALDVAEKEA